MPLRITEYLQPLLLAPDKESFQTSILNPNSTRDQIGYVERLLGKSEQYANNIASEIIKDMQSATHYPPTVDSIPSASELADTISQLISNITLKKEEAASSKTDDGSSLFE